MLLREFILQQLFSIPEGAPSDPRNTPFFNILCANPSLARIYADFFRRHGANPSFIKDLEVRSGIFSDPDHDPEKHFAPGLSKGNPMSINQNPRICTHIKVNGVRCGSPALREEVFCYFHQRMIRGVRTPARSRIHPIALIENEASIQASLIEIINAIVRNHIDIARARVILRALHIAVKNGRRGHFIALPGEAVTEIPQYPPAPAPAGPFSIVAEQAAALATINVAQEEEPMHARLQGLFYKSPDPTQRKPPISVKANRGTKKETQSDPSLLPPHGMTANSGY
jgi:hypothetical protein